MNKFILYLLVLCLAFVSKVNGQSYPEIGVHLGLANYSGDLSSSNVGPVIAQSHFSGGIQAKYNLNKSFSGKLAFNYATVSGTDALSGSESLKARNLSFSTMIFEGSLGIELNILPYLATINEYHFAPYVSLGIGVFKFDPTAVYEGSVVRLQPLGTEGQGTSFAPNNPKYNLVQMNIPFGGGIKVKLAEGITAYSELIFRWTFTDYLDDVSTVFPGSDILLEEGAGPLAVALSNRSGEPKEPGATRGGSSVNDYYAAGVVGIAYAIVGSSGQSRGRKFRNSRKNKISCPKF